MSDHAVFAVQKRLARDEGIFCEPAGAVALAGVIQAVERGELDPQTRVICLVSGSGFKDADSIARMNADSECPLVDLDAM